MTTGINLSDASTQRHTAFNGHQTTAHHAAAHGLRPALTPTTAATTTATTATAAPKVVVPTGTWPTGYVLPPTSAREMVDVDARWAFDDLVLAHGQPVIEAVKESYATNHATNSLRRLSADDLQAIRALVTKC